VKKRLGGFRIRGLNLGVRVRSFITLNCSHSFACIGMDLEEPLDCVLEGIWNFKTVPLSISTLSSFDSTSPFSSTSLDSAFYYPLSLRRRLSISTLFVFRRTFSSSLTSNSEDTSWWKLLRGKDLDDCEGGS